MQFIHKFFFTIIMLSLISISSGQQACSTPQDYQSQASQLQKDYQSQASQLQKCYNNLCNEACSPNQYDSCHSKCDLGCQGWGRFHSICVYRGNN